MQLSSSRTDRRSLLAGSLVAALMIAQQVGAKATRDAFFLSEHGPGLLPAVMLGSALLSLVTAFAMSGALVRHGPSRAVPWVFSVSAVLFVVEWVLAPSWPRIVSVALYLHLGALGPIVVSGFWSVVNERFDPHSAKTFVTRIAACAAAGGALGGLLAERVSALLSLQAMLPVLAVVNVTCGILLPALAKGEEASMDASSASEPPNGSGGLVSLSGYLKKVAAVALLTSVAAGLVDFAVKAEATKTMTQPEELAAFFAFLHALLGVLGFLVQTLVSGRMLKVMGLGATLALLPGVVLLGAGVAAAATRLWSVIVAKALETGVRSSAFRSGYELLYIPVERRQKRAAKTLIDVGADRFGDMVAAGLAMAVLLLLPQASVSVALAVAAAVSLLALLLSFSLHRGYVAELASSLRSGVVRAADIGVRDATTAKTLADSTMAINREELLAEIEALRSRQGHEAASPKDDSSPSPLPRTLERARVLLQSDALKVNELLGEPDLEPELISIVVPWLGDDRTLKAAALALRRVGAGNEGVLADAMLDANKPLKVRAMLPRVLRYVPTERARDALLSGLGSDSFDVRVQAARGLLRLCSKHPELRPEAKHIYRVIEAEATTDTVGTPTLGLSSFGSAAPAPTRLDHTLTLLSTVGDAEPLALCRNAFAHGDAMTRGTAVEYLENALPGDVFHNLRRFLDFEAPRSERRARQRAEILTELASSTSSLKLDGVLSSDD